MEYILEESAHCHTLVAETIEVISETLDSIELQVSGPARLIHGQHGTLLIERGRIKKYVQQEYNPITERYVHAFD